MDTNQIRELIELMVEHDLTRVEIEEGETHILLKRGHPPVAAAPSFAPPPAAAPVPIPAASPAPTDATPAAEAPTDEVFIRSPMVGTFYASPDPDSPAFVAAGDRIGADSVVCLVEAMKVFNEIKAEVSGTITRVLVQNAAAVEFDQPLFAVKPA